MEQKRRALGKGLEQLFNTEILDIENIEEKIVESAKKDEIIDLDLNQLRSNPYQPRIYFDEDALNELSESIKTHGVFQPIIVKKSVKGYEIVAGERRVKASIKAGLNKIPAIIREFSDNEMMQIALLENLQRENLSPIEEAKAYKDIITAMNITQEEIAKMVGKSRSHVTNMLGLLRLPLEIKKLINNKKISMAHARILSKLENKEQIFILTQKILDEGISVRELEELTTAKPFAKHNPKPNYSNRQYVYLEEKFVERFGFKTKITDKKIEIKFKSEEELNKILEQLNITIE